MHDEYEITNVLTATKILYHFCAFQSHLVFINEFMRYLREHFTKELNTKKEN